MGKKVCLQGSRKVGCPAHIIIKQFILYPEFQITDDEKKQLAVRTLREKKMQALRSQLLKDPSSVQVVTKSFISLPTADAHKGHQSGPGMACYTRRVHPTVVNKIGETVGEGITDVQTMKRML